MIRSILKSLLKTDAYPENVTAVELIQTHISYIFLTDKHVYKIKKPVDFGFLNFSTIDRRRFYCNEEVRLNRRLCPDIYEGVVELRETELGAAFQGDGAILDYAVKMRRLPADKMLDKLIANRDITAATMREVSRIIAEFHQNAVTSEMIAEHGRLEHILYNWQENFDQAASFEELTLPVLDREFIQSWVISFCTAHEGTFQKRVDNGFIRECDGDIHLENICLDNGSIHIFDCIEFNDRFRCCDTAADIAFLLMDLDYHGRHDLSDDVIDEYISVTDDIGAVDLIDFYKIYRAFVRGKVESFRLKDTGITPEEQNDAKNRAIRYFRLVRGYIERSYLAPTLFITCGLMGTGKSTLSAQLSFELGITSYNSDVIRKHLVGLSSEDQNREAFNEGLYSQQKNTETYAELLRLGEQQLAAGHSVIVDACFTHRNQRALFAALADRYAVRFIILHISCSNPENKQRLLIREASGISVSDGRLELFANQSTEFESLDESEGTIIILHGTKPPALLTNEIYSRLASC